MDPNIIDVYFEIFRGRGGWLEMVTQVFKYLMASDKLIKFQKNIVTMSKYIAQTNITWGPFGPQHHSRVNLVMLYFICFCCCNKHNLNLNHMTALSACSVD